MIPRLAVASKNPDKVSEIEEILGSVGLVDEIVRDLTWEDVEETGTTLEENALLKARHAATETGLAAYFSCSQFNPFADIMISVIIIPIVGVK